MVTVALSLITLFGINRYLNARKKRKLTEENAVRGRLGLPPLTLEQFSLQIVEKSADYRHHINQHM